MDFVTLISVLAGIVTIVGGTAGFLRYLHTRHRKVMSPHFLNLNLPGRHQEAIKSCQEALRKNPSRRRRICEPELGTQCARAPSGSP